MRDEHHDDSRKAAIEREQDKSWYVVYITVLVFTVLVISALWMFSRHFSS